MVPFLSVTGSEDTVPALRDVTPEERTLPFRYMPGGGKYLLVLQGADHADFSGNKRGSRDERVAAVVQRVTLAFWRSTLLADTDAAGWLKSGSVRTLLREGDHFDSK